MIGVSKLLCGLVTPHDILRYGRKSKELPSNMLQFSSDKKPIVVWNMTDACNLRCVHCYASASPEPSAHELTTSEAKTMIEDIAQSGSTTLLFSGGEPLCRKDLFELGAHAKSSGLRTVISTNGTLIDDACAARIKSAGFSYVGISLDGTRETNDRFRGCEGAYDDAIAGIKNCVKHGVKVGLRFTINKANYLQIPNIFELMLEQKVTRVCFYHLVYSGRGSGLINDSLTLLQARNTSEYIFDKTVELFKAGHAVEVLTVDNHADGVFLYLKEAQTDPQRAGEILTLLEYNGGNNSAIAIACVDSRGEVHPDQFWRHYSFGNVKNKPFSKIWPDISDDLMLKLKNRKPFLKGRCSICKYLNICNGNFRVRAEAIFNDIWAPDPACYLTDEEIGLDAAKKSELESRGEIFKYEWLDKSKLPKHHIN